MQLKGKMDARKLLNEEPKGVVHEGQMGGKGRVKNHVKVEHPHVPFHT